MRRGQQISSVHSPSAMQPFCVSFLPACLSQSCSLPKPILYWLVSPSPAFCSSCHCPVQLGHSQVPAARWRTLLPYHSPEAVTPGWKLRERCTQTCKLPQKSSIAMIRVSQAMCWVHACTREGKKQLFIEYLKQFHGNNLLPLSSKWDFYV